ncbi:MAG TPA: ferritin family protein [candidate division Zixibacteria bacterium]|nr:ferritin family protein [candidate division Zixibacteria bacterium]
MTDIFEYAMKMETDGRDFYLRQAAKADQKQFKQIWEQLADDELKHFHIFKALRDGQAAEYKEGSATPILATARNVFEDLKAAGRDFTFAGDVEKAWVEAREVERRSEEFYRDKATQVETEGKRTILNRIADEEHKHFVTLDNVIHFLRRPKEWLEDAEWRHSDEY